MKILSISSIRSDYDLTSGLYKTLLMDKDIDFKLIVSGAHLSDTYGRTIKYIYKDGIPILDTIESLIDSNTPSSRLKTASIFLQNSINSVERFSPDLIILVGDREDMIAGALLGAYLKIPTVHFFGGDHVSDGNVDNSVRNAISKLASVHFVIHHEHKKRLMRIGEHERRIFEVGSPALDKFVKERKITRNRLLDKIGENKIRSNNNYAVVVFHPLLGSEQHSGKYFEMILQAIEDRNLKAFVSFPNTDAGNRKIIKAIEKYRDSERFVFYKNMNRRDFINLLRHAEFLIGNSSLGILEAPSIPLGVINVGERQRGRFAAKNVIFVDCKPDQIKAAIKKVCSKSFNKELKKLESPYGDGRSIDRIYNLIKKIDFRKYLYKQEDPLGISL